MVVFWSGWFVSWRASDIEEQLFSQSLTWPNLTWNNFDEVSCFLQNRELIIMIEVVVQRWIWWIWRIFLVSGTRVADQNYSQQSRFSRVPRTDACLRRLVLEPVSTHQCDGAATSVRRFVSVRTVLRADRSPQPVSTWRDLTATGPVCHCRQCCWDEAGISTSACRQSSCACWTCVAVHQCIQQSIQFFYRLQCCLGQNSILPSSVCVFQPQLK